MLYDAASFACCNNVLNVFEPHPVENSLTTGAEVHEFYMHMYTSTKNR